MATREYFWGVELSEKQKEVVWDPEKEDEEDDINTSGLTHFLFLKQAVLGKGAKDDERNVVEITAEDFDGNSISLPLLSLKMGLNESTVLDIGASPPITLKLVSGTGPVCLTGQHALELSEDDFSDDEAEESPVKLPPRSKATKRAASSTVGPAKKAKLDQSDSKDKKDEAEEDDDDYDSEEDEDFTMNMGDESDEDSDGDDESGDEEDDDDDDEDEEEEKESPEKTPKDKGKVNGAGPKKTEQKKTPKSKEKPTVDQLKKLIMQSPSKPKKQAKFVNYVKNAFKISDEKTLDDLWTWYKENALKG